MRKKLFFLGIIFPLFMHGQVTGYEHRNIVGFDVYIQDEALKAHDSVTLKAIDLLTTQLETINGLGLKDTIIDALHQVKLFMEWNSAYSAAVYHPSRQWLMENGHEPEKAQSVEVSNIQNFIDWSALNQPYMVLHELAHAYHHQVLGFDYEPIIAAYEQALALSTYDSVALHTGNGKYIKRNAYAKTNKLEYFAELTESYLGENDFFPFVRKEFEAHDAKGYQVLQSIWQFEGNPGTKRN